MTETFQDAMLKIHCCHFYRGVYPWVQNYLVTPYWRFYWNPTPGACIRIGGRVLELTPSDFYVIPGHLKFRTFASKPFDHFFIHFKLNDRLPLRNEIYRLPADPEGIRLIREFQELEGHPGNELPGHIRALAVLTPALLRLDRELFRLPVQMDSRVEKLCRKIGLHPECHYANEELAEEAGLARNAFLRLFREETGESPQCYCRRRRIERACELLHFSGDSMKEIAEATGFADRYHFSRVFKKILGFPPAAYRRGARQQTRKNLPPEA